MPLFMDIHEMEGGVAFTDVAKAHMADLETQDKYGVKYLGTGSTRRRAGSSASSRPPTPRPPTPSTARPTGWLPRTSSRFKRGPEPSFKLF
jgi:hypothetical protein